MYHWKRQPYFFLANRYLKQDISAEYAIVDFIPIWSGQTKFFHELGLNIYFQVY